MQLIEAWERIMTQIYYLLRHNKSKLTTNEDGLYCTTDSVNRVASASTGLTMNP